VELLEVVKLEEVDWVEDEVWWRRSPRSWRRASELRWCTFGLKATSELRWC